MDESIHGSSVPTRATAPRGVRLDLAQASDAPMRRGNHLSLLKNGPNTFDDWLEAISRAEHWIHLDNYIFRADGVGQRFAEALAAKEGSGVRVLYDLFGCLDVPRSSNWEIELVAEDAGFSSKMERLFEEDLADAREVLLMKAGWRREVRPDRAIESTNRRARRGIVGSGMGSAG